ncbi:MAG: hypothetical protein K5872_06600 [Rhizobiaceae bacterium]|nr:hypothetical protein [Rhizobiaceae bacterium]MCV0405882.1 hypothetical protein [Rhizobiaceae bacterium]
MSSLPPLPPGFVIEDAPSAKSGAKRSAPPPPAGFVLETERRPQHFDFDGSNVPGYNPETGLVERQPLQRNDLSGSKIDAIVRGAADLATFGLADEIAAGADAALNPILGTGRDAESFGQRFRANVADQRATDESDQENRFGYRLGGQIAGGVAGATGIARAGGSVAANAANSGKGWFARMLGGSADGAIQAGAYGLGSGEGLRNRVESAARMAPLGMALGGTGELAATGIGNAARSMFRGAGDTAPGINPAARVSEADRFGIPLSRAQATGSVRQANIENQLRSQGAMQAFDRAQREAIETSTGNVQRQLAGDAAPIVTPSAAFDSVPGRLRGVRDSLKAASQGAYEASVNNPNVLVDGEAVRSLPAFIKGRLDADQILVDPMYHQGASRALQFIDDYLGRLPGMAKQQASGPRILPSPDGEITNVSAQLRWIENLRAGLRKNFPPIGQDAPALKAISRALDEWTDDVFDRGLVSASDEVLDQLKQARAKWSEYKAMAEPKAKIGGKLNPTYEAQSTVRRIMDKQLSPEEVGQMLFGSSVAAPRNTSFMTAQLLKKTLGPGSPEWNGIRQSFWLRATRAGDEAMSPARIAKNLDGLLNGQGKGVSQVLYSPDERKLMTSYLSTMRALTPAREGFNNSNTANRLMPRLARYGQAIMGVLAGGGSMAGGLGPLEALGVGAATSGVLQGVRAGANMSRAATATTMPVPTNPSGAGGAFLRGAGAPAIPMTERRPPLELTVTRGR